MPASGRRPVAFDCLDDFAMATLFALHVDRNDSVKGWHQPQDVENESQQHAGNDQAHIEQGREQLPIEQQPKWRNEDRQNIDHCGAGV
jgi:hypothetical protein